MAATGAGIGTVTDPDLELLCINTIRALCMDAIRKADSGHPGTPMGIAPVAYLLPLFDFAVYALAGDGCVGTAQAAAGEIRVHAGPGVRGGQAVPRGRGG